MTTTRLEIQELLAKGLSRRSAAAALGVSDRTLRRTLQSADMAADKPAAADIAAPAATADYVRPEDRVEPPVVMDGALSLGIPADPAGRYKPCPVCHHICWRIASGSPIYECACRPGTCHAKTPVVDPVTGNIAFQWRPFRISADARPGARPIVG